MYTNISLCKYICVQIHIHTYIYIYICVYIYMYVYLYGIHIYIHESINVYGWDNDAYTCAHVCAYLYADAIIYV
jgi:hypothetical protein